MVTLMPHNLDAYDEFCRVLEEKKKCAYVAASGTGKSYVVSRYIEEHGLLGHELILCPSNPIIRQWKKAIPELNVITYQKLTRSLQDLTDIRLIVCDEMHHLGGRVWEKKFREMTDGFTGLIAGATATPIRHLDGARNTVEEFFDGNVVWGLSLGQAIDKGVLPRFHYTAALFNLPKRIVESREEACKDMKTKHLYAQLDILASRYSVDSILKGKLPMENHKVIVFTNKIANVGNVQSVIEGIYPEAEYFTIHHGYSPEENEESISSFETCKKQSFLFCIDMLSEGRHIKDVDTVIMFRKTISPRIYEQQLGRCLDSGADVEPQVFDFVGNLYGLKEYGKETRISVNLLKRIQEEITHPERQIIVDSHFVEMLEVISRITAFLNGTWTEEEDDILREHYNKSSRAEMERLIPNHTWSAILSRASQLGVASNRHRWTTEEDALIRKCYNEKDGKDRLLELLPGRPWEAIKNRASRLGVASNRHRWTTGEDALIRKFYNKEDGKERLLELLPGHPWETIRYRASQLGVANNRHRWTTEEDALIRKYYNEKDGKECLLELLPGRPWETIMQRAWKLGMTKDDSKL